MRVWRLTKPEFAPGLDGEGARLWGGRWNSPGVPMVYCAGSLALAALEYVVHLPPAMRQAGKLPELVAVGLDVPDDALATLDPADLPAGYGIPDCRAVGDQWIMGADSLGLWVPSRIIPRESNLLLNPAHPAMARLRVTVAERFGYDDRMGG